MDNRHNPLAEVEEETLLEATKSSIVVVLPPEAQLSHNVVRLTKQEALSMIASLAVQLSVSINND